MDRKTSELIDKCKKNFCKNLKVLRKTKRLTQEGIAMKLNLSKSAYNALECGKVTPRIDDLLTFSNFYKVSVQSLLSEVNSNEDSKDVSKEITKELIEIRNVLEYLCGNYDNSLDSIIIYDSLKVVLKKTNHIIDLFNNFRNQESF